jgi:hypothetical protein
METKETNLSPWLHSIQQTFRTPGLFTTIESRQSDEFASRIESTREKINSLLNTLYGLEEKLGVPISSYGGRIGDLFHVERNMLDIRNAIGVYGIYHPTHSRRERQPNMVWNSYAPVEKLIISPKEGKEWLDYFGQDDGITGVGGYVVVSLSDKGIEYLNSIWERVSFLSSSYDTVTV